MSDKNVAFTSWKPEFEVNGKWATNAQRFATKEEAEGSALCRFLVWTQPTNHRASGSTDPVNYRFDAVTHQDVMINR